MSFSILKQIGDAQKKQAMPDIRSGDTVRVTQKIKEGDKFRFQMFEGVVIRVDRKQSHTARIVVRKVTSGVGVEKSYLIHSPLVEKIEIVRRAKVRRNYLSYLRERFGKSARLESKEFDRAAANNVEAKIADETDDTVAEPAEVSKSAGETENKATEAESTDKAEDKLSEPAESADEKAA